jgi:hypothetical protein
VQVEENQVGVQFTADGCNLTWIGGAGDPLISLHPQDLFQQVDIGLLIVDDEDAGRREVNLSHQAPPTGTWSKFSEVRRRCSSSMCNSFSTSNGFVK